MLTAFRRFNVVILTAACLGLFVTQARADGDVAAAGKYVDALAAQALNTITNKSNSKDQKQAALEQLFSNSVDFQWVGKFVMGRFWREASDAQKARYLPAYKNFLILHYTSRFADYTSGSYKILDSKDDGDGEFTVSMQLRSDDPSAEPVLVEYRLHKQEGGFKIFDVIVEGVSLITTQRSEFASVITNNGLDSLIAQLIEKSKTGAGDVATQKVGM